MLGVKNNRGPITGAYAKLVESKINETESTDDKLVVDVTMVFAEPLSYTEITIEKPEDMSDEQFKVFMKHLHKEIEENNIHNHELTS